MPEQQKTKPIVLDTQDVQTIYVNQANFTVSFHDFRIYLSESYPKHITPGVSGVPAEMAVSSKISLVMSPEFGKALSDALKTSVEKYEAQFGKLRKKPDLETVKAPKK